MRQMKDSGIEWIGEIPEYWKIAKVKQLFSIGRGRVIATTELTDSGYPVYSSQTKNNGVLGYLSTFDFECSQLTWTTDGANAGTVFLREGKHNCTNVCGTLTPYNLNNNLHYLLYILSHTAFYHKRADINGYKIMNNEMAEIKIILPPLDEQNCISAYLDRQCGLIDNVIEKTKASVEEYKKLRQAVITQAVTKGVRGDRPMKDSGIEHVDMIPIEWNEMKMKYFMYIRARLGWKGLTADEYVDEGYTFIGTPNIDECGNIDWVNVNYITKERYDESPEIMLSEGDVLLTKDGAGIGKCAYIDYLPNEATPNGSLAVITCNEMMYGKYLFYYYKSYYFQKYIDQIKAGMGVPHLFQGDLKEIAIPVPSKEEQREIISYLDSKSTEIDSLISKKEQFLTELEAYKKSLIYEYVTGKKEVPQA